MFFGFNEEGSKVTRLEEMMDSEHLRKFSGGLMEHVNASGGGVEKAWGDAVERVNQEIDSKKQ